MDNSATTQLKDELRARLRHWRRSLTPADGALAGAEIAGRLPAMPVFERARRILAYCSMPSEVDTRPLLDCCFRSGKQLCVPAWLRGERRYALAELTARTALRPGPLGISEPVVPQWVAPTAVDLALIPGVAFDRHGGRLGHGGGFFDRLLADFRPDCCRVGLAFDGQMAAAVPMEAHDIGMHLVMTQTQTWICAPVPPAGESAEDG